MKTLLEYFYQDKCVFTYILEDEGEIDDLYWLLRSYYVKKEEDEEKEENDIFNEIKRKRETGEKIELEWKENKDLFDDNEYAIWKDVLEGWKRDEMCEVHSLFIDIIYVLENAIGKKEWEKIVLRYDDNN